MSKADLTKKIIILSHQGSFSSETTFYNERQKVVSASGSVGMNAIYNQYKENIALWVHGHTHAPMALRDNNVVQSGMFGYGRFTLVTVDNGEIADHQVFRFK
jgi:proteasome lid subunit RPN8/RPN11